MPTSSEAVAVSVPELVRLAADDPLPDAEWVPRLCAAGPVRDDAVARLHALLLRAARHQIARLPQGHRLGYAVREEIAHSAADEAVVSVLGRLDSFEGRSRFTTWAFKFGILHAGVEAKRTLWNGREVDLDGIAEPAASAAHGVESRVEARDTARAVGEAMATVLTAHQRTIATALLIDQVPIDVLADRLGTTRGALYKTLHEARRRLRAALADQGLLPRPAARKGADR